MTCPNQSRLLGFLEGTLRPHEAARLIGHLDRCAACRLVLAHLRLARTTDAPQKGAPTLEAFADGEPAPLTDDTVRSTRLPRAGTPPQVGRRYVLHGLLGQGGMGRVHRATDRLTGRAVALKHVRSTTCTGEASCTGISSPATSW